MEENNNEKKRQVRLAIIGVTALLLLTLGATFAFFLIDTDSSTSKSSIKSDIENIDSIALQKVTDNLHVNLSAADMAEANKNTEYFGDDEADYVKTLDEGMHNLGKLTATGGNGKTKYMCTANAVITMQVANETDMGKFFNTGDAYLYLNAGSLQQRIDLSELKESGTMTIPFEIGITSESERQIDGYVEIINTSSDQTYLANKTLNIDVTFQDLECNVGVSEVETILRKNDKESKLTTNLVNGLYRYQGNSIVTNLDTYDREDTVNDNYICLGSDCSTAESNDMFRILGVSEDGIIKVIKNTPIEQKLQWWTDNKTDIKWPESLAYKYLNNEYYNELSVNLKNQILETIWKYGIVNDESISEENQSKMNQLWESLNQLWESEVPTDDELRPILIEITKLYVQQYLKAESELTNKTIGKISLMNIADYCSSFESNTNVNCGSSGINLDSLDNPLTSDAGMSWLTPHSDVVENTATYSGIDDSDPYSIHRQGFVILPNGDTSIGDSPFDDDVSSRPVFFLTSDIELSGEGTIESPFTIGIE